MIDVDIKIDKVKRLKEERDAVILAHYYVEDDVQRIADYVGDSYYLSKIAAETDHKTILFCGVSFMAESAKILSPDKTVLIPDFNAHCPMASMASKDCIMEMKSRFDDLAVVCYINSTVEIKSLSDVCVTSSNAVNIVKNLPNKNIYFIPDGNLGRFVAKQVPEKNIILNDGYCHVHTNITIDDINKAKGTYPEALVLVHPECNDDLVAIGDYVGSTSGIIDFARESSAKDFIICTEVGILYKLKENCPDKNFHFPNDQQICPDMKLITLDKVINSLEKTETNVEVDKSIINKAKMALEKMHELAYN